MSSLISAGLLAQLLLAPLSQAPQETPAPEAPATPRVRDLGVIEGVGWLAKAADAHGGKEILDAKSASRYHARTRSLTPTGEVEGEVEVYYAEPDRLRIDAKTGGMRFLQILNGDQAWVYVNGKLKLPTPESIENMKRVVRLQYDRFPLRYRDYGYMVKICLEEYEGIRRVIRVELQTEDQDVVAVGISPDTGLVHYVEYPTRGPYPFELVVQRTIYEDYKVVDGLPIAHTISTFHGQVPRTITTIDEFEVNPKISDDLFAQPEVASSE